MHYKIHESSASGQKLAAIFQRDTAFAAKATDLAKSLSGMENPKMIGSSNYFSGYLFAIEFDSKPGRAWKKAFANPETSKYYRPRDKEFELRTDLAIRFESANDPINNAEVNDIFCLCEGVYGSYENGDRKFYRLPKIQKRGEYYLINIADAWASSITAMPEDMTPIRQSEYWKIIEDSKETD